MPKINRNGTFMEFKGITTVASIKIENSNFWKGIYDFMAENSVITDHYSLLPWESYHMTTYDLYTKEFSGIANFEEFIDRYSNFFIVFNDHINRFLNVEVSIQIKHVITENVLQLIVTIPEELKHRMLQLATIFDIQHTVPSHFHITLAYQYKHVEQRQKEQLSLDIFQKIKSLNDENSLPLLMEKPSLCYFNSMEKFVPWDGSYNPFLNEEAVINRTSINGFFRPQDNQENSSHSTTTANHLNSDIFF